MGRSSQLKRGAWARVLVVVCLIAASLANALIAPAETVRVPSTLMSRVTFDGARGRVALSFRPTHVGFTWEGSHDARVVFRTVAENGRASKWRVAPVSHDMEMGTTRFSGLMAVDRPVRVEYRKRFRAKVDQTSSWMSAITMESINTRDGPLREVTLRSTGEEDAGAPDIVTRAEWGADESLKRSSGECERTFHPVRQLFVHHTAGSNYDTDGAATMRAIYAYHTQSRGWCDIGYNFVIDWSGTIFEGRWARPYAPWETHDSEDHRNHATAGAHVAGFNSGSVGISLMGNFTSVDPPSSMKSSLKEVLAWEADRHGLDPTGSHTFNGRRMQRIAGHRNAGYTACPGNKLYDQLPKLRRKTKAMIGVGRAATTLSLRASVSQITYGQSSELFGLLTGENDAPLAAQTVTLYRKDGAAHWVEDSTVITGPDGSFSTTVLPAKRLAFAASFDTGATLWGSDSRVVTVEVRHAVTMAPSDRSPDGKGVYRYSPKAKSVLVGGEVRPRHSNKSVTVKLFKQSQKTGTYNKLVEAHAPLEGGRSFSHSLQLPDRRSGTRYKVTAKMPRDGAHEPGYSGPRWLVVD